MLQRLQHPPDSAGLSRIAAHVSGHTQLRSGLQISSAAHPSQNEAAMPHSCTSKQQPCDSRGSVVSACALPDTPSSCCSHTPLAEVCNCSTWLLCTHTTHTCTHSDSSNRYDTTRRQSFGGLCTHVCTRGVGYTHHPHTFQDKLGVLTVPHPHTITSSQGVSTATRGKMMARPGESLKH
jgi:hypothetical protein